MTDVPPDAPASPESVIESVRFTRRSTGLFCHNEKFAITWTTPDGEDHCETEDVCAPCDFGSQVLTADTPPQLVLSLWVAPKALAYIMAIPTQVEDGWDWEYEARVAIRVPEDITVGESWKEGPGIFPAPIERLPREYEPDMAVIVLQPGDVSI